MSPSRHHHTDSKNTGGELLRHRVASMLLAPTIHSAPCGSDSSQRFGRCLDDDAFTSKARAAARAPRKGNITYELETPSVVFAQTNFRPCVRKAISSVRKKKAPRIAPRRALFLGARVSESLEGHRARRRSLQGNTRMHANQLLPP